MTRFLPHVAFVAGLVIVLWIGTGYVGHQPLALAVTALIAACYLAGTVELWRFRRNTAALNQVLDALHAPPSHLAPWLETVPGALRNAVRLRVKGERVGLPGPALSPYLTGLLVLLGMLGTFLGMVATLRGTGIALDSAADLEAVRASLSAPVKGLGLAFGTSVAGVAASAMLGLMTTLCRRERLHAAQLLDSRVATHLRGFTRMAQREESIRLLQRQAEAAEHVPQLVEQLQGLMDTLARQQDALNTRLLAGQDRFHTQAAASYTALAESVDRSLKSSLTDSARAASATIKPVVEATMAGIAREATALHGTLRDAVQQQLDGLSSRLEDGSSRVAALWQGALAEQQRTSETLARELGASLERTSTGFEQRSAALVDGLAARLDASAERMSAQWHGALAQHEATSQSLARGTHDALAATVAKLGEHFDLQAATLLRTVERTQTDRQAALVSRDAQRLDAWTQSLEATAAQLRTEWQQAGTQAAAQQQAICDALAQTARELSIQNDAQTRTTLAEVARVVQAAADAPRATAEVMTSLRQQLTDALARDQQLLAERSRTLEASAAAFEQHAAALLQQVDRAHADQQAAFDARDAQRQAAWTGSLDAMSATLRDAWQQAAADSAEQQQAVCRTLAQTAERMSADAEAHTKNTLAEITRLVEAAAEAPRAAAEVIGGLRLKLADSMARDNTLLEERSRLLETLNTLLDAVNHASTEQRGAIDALVTTSADLLERVGRRFTEQADAHTAQITDASAQVTSSAAEVASLGEAFGHGVQLFSESNEALVGQLQRIEAALSQSLARSDEQLAYYVAQAREVIDLSLMSQKRIVDDLQRLADTRATEGSDA